MAFRVIVGVVLVLMGLVWVFQGLGAIDGYGMSGHLEWTFFGTILAIVGAATLRGAVVLRRSAESDDE